MLKTWAIIILIRLDCLSVMSSTSPLTHFDAQGQAHMVDVGTKAADRGMVMTGVKVLEKQGGKSGHWVTQE